MSATAKVITLEDNFSSIRKSVTGKQLERAALAGGYVIEGQAKINVNQTFSSFWSSIVFS